MRPVIKKQWIFMCRVLLPLDDWPCFSNFMELWLLGIWYHLTLLNLDPPKYILSIKFQASGHTNPPVLLQLNYLYSTSIWLTQSTQHPVVSTPPPLVWIIMSWWTKNITPTHHLMVLDPCDSRINTSSQVLGRYLRRWIILFLSYLSVSLTIVVRKFIPVSISGHACFLKNRSLSMMVWKICASYSLIFCVVLFTSNKWLAAGVTVLPFPPP